MTDTNLLNSILEQDKSLSEEQRKKHLALALDRLNQEKKYNKIAFFKPNPAQLQFFKNTLSYNEILNSWANRMGKTFSAGAFIYYAASGRYPKDWSGRRWDKPVRILILGYTYKSIRESSQRILLDEYKCGTYGTGVIPKVIFDQCECRWVKDENDTLDYIKVPHVDQFGNPDGLSDIQIFTQKTDAKALMGTEIDIVWSDEQLADDGHCPPKHYGQFIRGTVANDNRLLLLTATPEHGRTKIFDWFEQNKEERLIHYAGLADSHYSPEKQERMIKCYPEDEREYRVYGKPKRGSGAVYRFDKDVLFCESFEIPKSWRRLASIDFGRTKSKCAMCWIAENPSTGVKYIYDSDWRKDADPSENAVLFRRRDQDVGYQIPISWPKDGLNSEASTGNQIAKVYSNLGLRMIGECAMIQGQDGKKTQSVESGIMIVQQLIDVGLLKIFDLPQNQEFLIDLNRYHRDENNKLDKASYDPHFLDCLRYNIIMFDRFAYSGSNANYQKVPLRVGLKKGIFH